MVLKRFFAKAVDLVFVSTPVSIILIIGLEILEPGLTDNKNVEKVLNILPTFLFLFLEPLYVSKFSFTPGKLLFGLRVLDSNGLKLNYTTAFARNWAFYTRGVGLVFFAPFTIANQVRSLLNKKSTTYDLELGICCINKKDVLNKKSEEALQKAA